MRLCRSFGNSYERLRFVAQRTGGGQAPDESLPKALSRCRQLAVGSCLGPVAAERFQTAFEHKSDG